MSPAPHPRPALTSFKPSSDSDRRHPPATPTRCGKMAQSVCRPQPRGSNPHWIARAASAIPENRVLFRILTSFPPGSKSPPSRALRNAQHPPCPQARAHLGGAQRPGPMWGCADPMTRATWGRGTRRTGPTDPLPRTRSHGHSHEDADASLPRRTAALSRGRVPQEGGGPECRAPARAPSDGGPASTKRGAALTCEGDCPPPQTRTRTGSPPASPAVAAAAAPNGGRTEPNGRAPTHNARSQWDPGTRSLSAAPCPGHAGPRAEASGFCSRGLMGMLCRLRPPAAALRTGTAAATRGDHRGSGWHTVLPPLLWACRSDAWASGRCCSLPPPPDALKGASTGRHCPGDGPVPQATVERPPGPIASALQTCRGPMKGPWSRQRRAPAGARRTHASVRTRVRTPEADRLNSPEFILRPGPSPEAVREAGAARACPTALGAPQRSACGRPLKSPL